MRLRYLNIIIFILVIVMAVMATRPHSPMGIFFRSMAHVGEGYTDMERILGLAAWGLVVVLFLVTVRALSNHDKH